MEANQKIKIYNTTLALKGVDGTFISVNPEGYYELYMKFNDKRHNVFLPVNNTVLISEEPVIESEESEQFSNDIVR